MRLTFDLPGHVRLARDTEPQPGDVVWARRIRELWVFPKVQIRYTAGEYGVVFRRVP